MFNLILILFLFEKEGLRPAATTEYSVRFSVLNAGFEVEGTLKVKNAHIRFDPDHFLQGRIHVTADASSIETGIGIRDKHLRRSDYLDANNYPEIQLTSKSFTKTGKNKFTGKFGLTIKSTTKEVIIPFTVKKEGDTTYFQGDFDINRIAFNIGEESLTLGETVHVQVSAMGEF